MAAAKEFNKNALEKYKSFIAENNTKYHLSLEKSSDNGMIYAEIWAEDFAKNAAECCGALRNMDAHADAMLDPDNEEALKAQEEAQKARGELLKQYDVKSVENLIEKIENADDKALGLVTDYLAAKFKQERYKINRVEHTTSEAAKTLFKYAPKI